MIFKIISTIIKSNPEYEANNLENMKSIVDKFVDHFHDSYFASCSMVIYVILLYKKDPMKVPPNRLNNLSIMERNIKYFDTLDTSSLGSTYMLWKRLLGLYSRCSYCNQKGLQKGKWCCNCNRWSITGILYSWKCCRWQKGRFRWLLN